MIDRRKLRKRMARTISSFLSDNRSAEQVADRILSFTEFAHALSDCPIAPIEAFGGDVKQAPSRSDESGK